MIVGPSEEAKDAGQTKREIAERYNLRRRWWTMLLERASRVSKLHAHITPGDYSSVTEPVLEYAVKLNYRVTQEECSAELYIDTGQGFGAGK